MTEQHGCHACLLAQEGGLRGRLLIGGELHLLPVPEVEPTRLGPICRCAKHPNEEAIERWPATDVGDCGRVMDESNKGVAAIAGLVCQAGNPLKLPS